VVLDFLMPDATSGDAELASAARTHGNVIVAERYVPSPAAGELAYVQPTTENIAAAVRPGLANFHLQASTFFSDVLLARRAPLRVPVHRAQYQGRWPLSLIGPGTGETLTMPGLALLAASAHRGIEPKKFLEDVPYDGNSISIPYRGRAGADGIPVVTGARLLQAMGQQELVASLGGVTSGDMPVDLVAALSSRVVLVCRVTDDTSDRFVTPLNLPLANRPDMSGCAIHAHLVEALLSGELVRVRGRVLGWLAVPLLVWAFFQSRNRWSLERAILVWIGSALAAGLAGTLIFHWTGGLALALGPPILAVLLTALALAMKGQP
jgi:CHASE2 domain-containing sensor protein